MLIRLWNKFLQKKAFAREFNFLKAQSTERFTLDWQDRYPCLNDRSSSMPFDRHYTYHVAWAARVVAALSPLEHVDISSSIYFSSILSAFVPVRYYDFRKPEIFLNGLAPGQADLLNLPFCDNSLQSLSCMHVIEHIGLGRYGDVLDYDGDLKAMAELKRVLAPGGSLLIAVPVGRARICFNAHRIYAYHQIIESFTGMELAEFSLIPDSPEDGGLIRHAPKEQVDRQAYACGCFWLRKPI